VTRRTRSTRLAAIILALGLAGVACGKGAQPQRLSGEVGPVTPSTTSAAPSSPTPNPAADVKWQPYSYDAQQGNNTGTTVTLSVPKWTETTTDSLHDYRSGQLLFRLDFRRPTGFTIGNWQNEAQDFASTHPGYKAVGLHSVDCPSGALDCADWEFTFPKDGITRHVFDRGIVVNDSLGFAVYVSGPVSQLAEVKRIFQDATQTIKFSVT